MLNSIVSRVQMQPVGKAGGMWLVLRDVCKCEGEVGMFGKNTCFLLWLQISYIMLKKRACWEHVAKCTDSDNNWQQYMCMYNIQQ